MKRLVGIVITLIVANLMLFSAYAIENEFEVHTGDVTFEDGHPIFHVQYTAPHTEDAEYSVGVHVDKRGTSNLRKNVPAEAAVNADVSLNGKKFNCVPGKTYSYYGTLYNADLDEEYYGETRTFVMPGSCEEISSNQRIEIVPNGSSEEKTVWFQYTASNSGYCTFKLHGNDISMKLLREDDSVLDSSSAEQGTIVFTQDIFSEESVYIECIIGADNSDSCLFEFTFDESPEKYLILTANDGVWTDQTDDSKSISLERVYDTSGYSEDSIALSEYANLLSRDGYILTGWNNENDGTGIQYSNFASITFSDIEDGETLYAQWVQDPGTPCVIFHTSFGSFDEANSDTEVSEMRVDAGLDSFIAPDVYRDGYTLIGWSDKTECRSTSNFYFPGENIQPQDDENLVLYALWIKNGSGDRVIIYDTNASNLSFFEREYKRDIDYTTTVAFGSNHRNLERPGYILNGWNTNANGTGTHYPLYHEIRAEDEFSDQYVVVLYAEWKQITLPDKYYVFLPEEGSFSDGDTYKIIDRKQPIEIPIPERDGYQFIGWHDQPTSGYGAENYYVFPELADTTANKSLYFYPIWIKNNSNLQGVVLSYNGGLLDTDAFADIFLVDAPDDGRCTLKLYNTNKDHRSVHDFIKNVGKVLTRSEYTFTGWNTKADGSGLEYSGEDSQIESNSEYKIFLYAQWEKNANTSQPGNTGGSGSSAGGGSPSNSIKCEKSENGTVSLSAKEAEEGDSVAIDIKPDEGYVLDKLTVTDKTGKSVKLTKSSETQYTFTMPDSKVTVKATFIETAGMPTHVFADVPEDFWAGDAIAWAFEKGYMNGTSETTFNPSGNVSRQQLWMILARVNGQEAATMAEAKAWAVDHGISDGTAPGASVTRQQMVTILYRYAVLMSYDVSSKADLIFYSDANSVASYARDAMSWAVANGIVSGTAQGTLNASATATRAQFAVILNRFCDEIA